MIKETYTSSTLDTTINVMNSKIESVRFKNIEKTSIRIYKDGYIGVAGAIGDFDRHTLEQEAIEALDQKIEYPGSPSINFTKSMDLREKIISENAFLHEMETLLELLNQQQPDFIYSNKISLTNGHAHMENEAGLKLEYCDKALKIGLVFKDKGSANVFDGYFEFEERQYDRNRMLLEMNQFLSAYKERIALPKKKRLPVLFVKNEAPILKLYTDLNGELYAAGSSIFSGKAGQKLFHEDFSFSQSLDPKDVINTPFFDAEGTVNADYGFTFIEKGILKAPYTDKRTAKKYGLELTGSSAATYDGVPSCQLLSFDFGKSEKSVKELLGGEPGILVMVTAGGDFTPDGQYAAPIQLSYLFDGKNLLGRLPEITLTSNVFDMFGKDYRGVGNDKVFPYSNNKLIVMEMDVAEA